MTKGISSSNGTTHQTAIGKFLRSLREASGRTLGSIGDEVGIAGTQIGAIERGVYDPAPKHLKELARVYYRPGMPNAARVKDLYLRMLVTAGYLQEVDLAITPTTNRRQQLEEQLTAAKGVVAGLEAKLRAYDLLFGLPSGAGGMTAAEATQEEGE